MNKSPSPHALQVYHYISTELDGVTKPKVVVTKPKAPVTKPKAPVTLESVKFEDQLNHMVRLGNIIN
jgi:dihydroneopterin aldolase